MKTSYEIPEGTALKRVIRNPREEAVYDVLGGRTQARLMLEVSRQAIHQLLACERVKDLDTAERIAAVTKREGREVPVIELMNLAPWHGPERHDADPMASKRRKKSAPAQNRTGTYGAAALTGASANAATTRPVLQGTRRA
jgi:hypothetical protein